MVEALGDTEKLIGTIDVLAEVDVVALINVTLVHISSKELLGDMLRGVDSEKIKHSEELFLGNMTVAGDVVVLEHGLQVNALVLDGGTVLLKDSLDLVVVLVASKVLSTGEESVSLGDGNDSGSGSLVNALDGESSVHVGAEVSVAEESLGISGLVLLSKSLEFVVSESKVHGGKDGFELVSGDTTLAELIEITEELLNTDSLHDNDSLESVLNIGGII